MPGGEQQCFMVDKVDQSYPEYDSIPSICGYRCFLPFAYEESGMDVVYLMRRKSQFCTGLQDLFGKSECYQNRASALSLL